MLDKRGYKVDLDRENSWYKEAQDLLLNKKIVSVKWCNWDDDEHTQTGLVFKTSDNVMFYLSSDDEGNNPGALHWSSNKKVNGRNHGILPVGVMDCNELIKYRMEKEKSESKKSKS
tara:strand:- start:106 stop:453 length:348 start_codon:yes stop_codon:yes gene_type:complete